MHRYDRTFSRYDAGWRADRYSMWYPGAYWAGAPMFGWGWGWDWPPYGPIGIGRDVRDYRPRRRPEDSGVYGRAADEAARHYARSHGYDEGYTIRPRTAERRPRRR